MIQGGAGRITIDASQGMGVGARLVMNGSLYYMAVRYPCTILSDFGR